ncbi:MAG: hypothetical protein PHV97_02870, partial [Candidatus Omnitrophica bacterium]|nr:hypothetical protein [Candidatus Omnitrophota bacterium]
MNNNVFLISGDPFLRAQKSKALIAEIEKKSGGPLARQTFSLDETPLETILAAARTLPFFSSGQVIHAQGAELLKEPDLAVLAAYLENPVSATTLILEADDLKGTSELQKLIKAKGQLILLAKDEARGTGAVFLQQKLVQHHKT